MPSLRVIALTHLRRSLHLKRIVAPFAMVLKIRKCSSPAKTASFRTTASMFRCSDFPMLMSTNSSFSPSCCDPPLNAKRREKKDWHCWNCAPRNNNRATGKSSCKPKANVPLKLAKKQHNHAHAARSTKSIAVKSSPSGTPQSKKRASHSSLPEPSKPRGQVVSKNVSGGRANDTRAGTKQRMGKLDSLMYEQQVGFVLKRLSLHFRYQSQGANPL